MSKKSVVIKMPVSEARRPEDRRERASAINHRAAGGAAGRPDESRSDQWVRSRDRAAASTSTPGGVFLDLAAERDLVEVAALSFLLPSALGWFWLRNLAARLRGDFD